MKHPTTEPCYVFWDNSNIFIPAQYVAEKVEGPQAKYEVRIQFENLFNLARAARPVRSAICVGSVPPDLGAVWTKLRRTGVEVELYERGSHSKSEQGVDQCLQVHMLRALADADEPAVAVLLTGDGAGYDTGIGFHADLERMAKRGWGIEVLSWNASCARRLREWAQSVGVFIALDDYYKQITFRQQMRTSHAVSLKHRPRASPSTKS